MSIAAAIAAVLTFFNKILELWATKTASNRVDHGTMAKHSSDELHTATDGVQPVSEKELPPVRPQ